MELTNDPKQAPEIWEPQMAPHHLKSHTHWVDSLMEKKRKQGRYYFHPAPAISVICKSPGAPDYLRWTNVYLDLCNPKSTFSESPGFPLEASSPDLSVETLQQRIAFLETQLESHRPYLQLYRNGATCLFLALLSLLMWTLTGVGLPLHPLFALGAVPVAIGVIVMAFLIRPGSQKTQ